MLTLVPLPAVLSLIGLHGQNSCVDHADDYWQVDGVKRQSFWFSKSAWSFVFIVDWLLVLTGKSKISIWVPDYFCAQTLSYLIDDKIELHYYPIQKDFSPDLEYISKGFEVESIDIILHVHYFGQYIDTTPLSKLCKQTGTLLIEDAAHVLVPHGEIGRRGDVVMYSQHKLFAIPDGALCLINEKGTLKKLKKMDKLRSDLLDDCQTYYQKFIARKHLAPRFFKWRAKRLLQKLLPNFFLAYLKRTAPFDLDAIPLEKSEKRTISPLSMHLLKKQVSNLEAIKLSRRKNYQALAFILKTAYGISTESLRTGEAPYMMRICFSHKKEAQHWYKKLVELNFLVTTWPDLPFSICEDENSIFAMHLRQTTFFLPVHQSLSYKYLLTYYGKRPLNKLLSRSCYHGSLVVKRVEDKALWETCCAQLNQVDLLQDWDYGEAKEQTAKVKVVRLSIETSSGKTLAIVQVLVRSLGFIKVVRINRGPLFCVPKPSYEMKYWVLSAFISHVKSKFSFLFWAPALIDNIENKHLLLQLGLHKRRMYAWCSGYLSLQDDQVELRKKLKASWRNQLKSAEEKYKITVKVLDLREHADAFLKTYLEFQQEKKFSGVGVKLVSSLVDMNKCIVLAAYYAEEQLGAIMLVKHGVTATYLIAWTEPKGRKYYVNNILLWQAALLAKAQNLKFFDVGGIDELDNKSVADFKRGLKPKEYSLVGEYWAWHL